MKPDVSEFKKFHGLLMSGAPEGYEPFYFVLEKGNKNPETSRGSWKKAGVTYEEACKWLEYGYNIGIAGTDQDSLTIVDIDDYTIKGQEKPTLTVRTRKRAGFHCFYFSKEDIPNIPTEDQGEIRAIWQYVVAAGSYVKTTKEDLDEEGVPEEYRDDRVGYYTVENPITPSKISFDELPQVFKDRFNKDKGLDEEQLIDQAEKEAKKTSNKQKNKQSELFDLTVEDITGSKHKHDRWESLFHGSTTGKNTSVSKDLIHCWRHNVYHTPISALCVLSGYADCVDAGFPHKHSGAGPSCVEDNPEAIYEAWKYAKQAGHISEDDPIPTEALKWYAITKGYCNDNDIVDGWKLPPEAYNKAIEELNKEGINPGRTEIKKKQQKSTSGLMGLLEEEEKQIVDSTMFYDPESNELYYIFPIKTVAVTFTPDPSKPEKTKETPCTVLGALGSAVKMTVDKPTLYYNALTAIGESNHEYFAEFEHPVDGRQIIRDNNTLRTLKEVSREKLNNSHKPGKPRSADLPYGGSKASILVDKWKYYVGLNEEIQYYIIVCWSVGSFMFDIFSYFPALGFIAEKGANKGGSAKIIGMTAWNPTSALVNPSDPTIYRIIQFSRPTMIAEEFHRIWYDKNRATLQQIYESGTEKGAVVPRCDENDYNKIWEYKVYSPKCYTSRKFLEFDEKAILITIPKKTDQLYAKHRKELDNDTEFREIQSNILRWANENWQRVKQVYDRFEPTQRLTGRRFNYWAVILSVCKIVFPDKYDEMLRYAEKDCMGELNKSYEQEEVILSWIWQKHGYTTKDILKVDQKDIKEETEMHHNSIKSALNNLGVIRKVRNTKRGQVYELNTQRLNEIFEERGYFKTYVELDESGGQCELCGESGANIKLFLEEGPKICHKECAEEDYPELMEREQGEPEEQASDPLESVEEHWGLKEILGED